MSQPFSVPFGKDWSLKDIQDKLADGLRRIYAMELRIKELEHAYLAGFVDHDSEECDCEDDDEFVPNKLERSYAVFDPLENLSETSLKKNKKN